MAGIIAEAERQIEDQAKRDTDSEISRLDSKIAEAINCEIYGMTRDQWILMEPYIKGLLGEIAPMLLERNRQRLFKNAVSNITAARANPLFAPAHMVR